MVHVSQFYHERNISSHFSFFICYYIYIPHIFNSIPSLKVKTTLFIFIVLKVMVRNNILLSRFLYIKKNDLIWLICEGWEEIETGGGGRCWDSMWFEGREWRPKRGWRAPPVSISSPVAIPFHPFHKNHTASTYLKLKP